MHEIDHRFHPYLFFLSFCLFLLLFSHFTFFFLRFFVFFFEIQKFGEHYNSASGVWSGAPAAKAFWWTLNSEVAIYRSSFNLRSLANKSITILDLFVCF